MAISGSSLIYCVFGLVIAILSGAFGFLIWKKNKDLWSSYYGGRLILSAGAIIFVFLALALRDLLK